MLEWLQNCAFSQWVVGSDSLLAYPTVLTLHTVGLGVVVGVATILNLRLLGVGAGIPLQEMRPLFRLFWAGFLINLVSGLVLFASAAVEKAGQPVFYVKLSCIAIAVAVTVRIRRRAFGADDHRIDAPAGTRALAGLSLALWTGAIVAGRLMAYLK